MSEQHQGCARQSTVDDGNATSDCNVVYDKNNNNNNYRCRAISVIEPDAYDISLVSVYRAYLSCLKNKRGANSYTHFTFRYEHALLQLYDDIRNGRYKPSPSFAFVITYPVAREIFAAPFIDRVVHHWIADRIYPLIEEYLIEAGNVTMNCRKGIGVHDAVKKVKANIERMTNGHTNDCWVFKGDIANFYMSIDKDLIYEMVSLLIEERYRGVDKRTLLRLLQVTINHCPQDGCKLCKSSHRWELVPKRKSLFYADRSKGLPIGTLTSQLLANLYAGVFAHWLYKVKGVDTLVLYADDFVFLTKTREEGLALIPEIREFLQEQLLIDLHPRKIYFQHYSNGVNFVGSYIKPHRTYTSKRVVSNFWERVVYYNREYRSMEAKAAAVEEFVSVINSYLGLMRRTSSYKIRRKICGGIILPHWYRLLYFENEYTVCRVKKRYNRHYQAKRAIRKGIVTFDDDAGNKADK